MKIFNCHLDKCGHTSLASALRTLGFKGYVHLLKDGIIIKEQILRNGFTGFPRFDFLSDFKEEGYSKVIPIIEDNFPEAKFILTTRDKQERMASAIHHRERIGVAVDVEHLSNLHDEIMDYYATHFRNKDNLLVLPIEAQNKWELLCGFLGKPVPNIPYPFLNLKPEWQR